METKKSKKKEAELSPKLVKQLGDVIEKAVDLRVAKTFKKLDVPHKKNLGLGKMNKNGSKSKVSKEEKFKAWMIGMATKDFSQYRNIVGKDAMNTTNTSQVIPPEEFIAEVLRLEEEFGVAKQFARLKTTDRTSIKYIKGATDVAIFDTDEEAVKTGTKNTYTNVELTFRKFAAIAPITDEELEDSAIDLWKDLSNRFARAYAEQEDKVVFTDATTGIVNAAGAAVVNISGDSIEDITYDEVNKAIYEVPTPSMKNGRFYFNRTILGVLQRIKDSQNRYIWLPGPNGMVDGTIWGHPYTLTEVLPGLTDDAAETAFIVFGDLKNTVLAQRSSLQAKIFDTGTVIDSDEDSLNLLTQDAQAMRVVKRFNSLNIFENAYSLIKTGATAS